MSTKDQSELNVYLNGNISPEEYIKKQTFVDKYLDIARKNDINIQVNKNLDKRVNEILKKASISGKISGKDLDKLDPNALIHASNNELIGIKGFVKIKDDPSLESEDGESPEDLLEDDAVKLLDNLKEKNAIAFDSLDSKEKEKALGLVTSGYADIEGDLVLSEKAEEQLSDINENDSEELVEDESNNEPSELTDEESNESFFGKIKNFFQDIGVRNQAEELFIKDMEDVNRIIEELTKKASVAKELKEPNNGFKLSTSSVYGFSLGESDIYLNPKEWGKILSTISNQLKVHEKVFQSSIIKDIGVIRSLITKMANDEKNSKKYAKEAIDYLDKLFKRYSVEFKEKILVEFSDGNFSLRHLGLLPAGYTCVLNDRIKNPALSKYETGIKKSALNKALSTKLMPCDKSTLDGLIGDFSIIKGLFDKSIKSRGIIKDSLEEFSKITTIYNDLKKESTNRELVNSIDDIRLKLMAHLVSSFNLSDQIVDSFFIHVESRIAYLKFVLNRY